MKKDLLNKFLYAGFKFGKIFAVFALILLILVMIGSGVCLLKIDNSKIVTPQFSVVKQALETNNNEYYNSSSSNYVSTNVIDKEKAEKKYKQTIENIIEKCKLKPFAYDMILSNLADYDAKYQNQYINGLADFVDEALVYLKDKYKVKMDSVAVSKDVLSDIIAEYNKMFDREIDRIEAKKQAQLQDKIVAGSTLAVSVLLFVICLFLPLLIKIEENTRQYLEIKQGKENEEN